MSRTRFFALGTGLAIFLLHSAIAAMSTASPIFAVPPLFAGAMLIALSFVRIRTDRDRRSASAAWGFATGIMVTQACVVAALRLSPSAAILDFAFAILCAAGTIMALRNQGKSRRALTFGGYYVE